MEGGCLRDSFSLGWLRFCLQSPAGKGIGAQTLKEARKRVTSVLESKNSNAQVLPCSMGVIDVHHSLSPSLSSF